MTVRFRNWKEALILCVPIVYVLGLYGPQLFSNSKLLMMSKIFRELLLGFPDS